MLHHHRHCWLSSSSKNTISGNIDLLSVWKIWCLWKWGQVPGLKWGVTDLNGSQHVGQPLMISKGKPWRFNVSIHEHPCSVNSNTYNTALQFLLQCRISTARLPTCHRQSEWLLSQSSQAYWCMKFIYFTPLLRPHLKSVAIQLWWEDSWYCIWLSGANLAENFPLQKAILAEIVESEVSSVIFGKEMTVCLQADYNCRDERIIANSRLVRTCSCQPVFAFKKYHKIGVFIYLFILYISLFTLHCVLWKRKKNKRATIKWLYDDNCFVSASACSCQQSG